MKMKITSYNSRGLNLNRKMFISDLLNDNTDILCLQETWLLPTQQHKLGTFNSSFRYHGISGVNDTTRILQGRPYGGCAILWSNRFDGIIKKIPCSTYLCNRLCCVKITLENKETVLLFSVYMPTSTDFSEEKRQEFIEVLCDIRSVMKNENCYATIIAGDLNIDFDRNDPMLSDLNHMMKDMNLTNAKIRTNCLIDYTYHNHDFSSLSHIDHFLTSQSLCDEVVNYTVNHDVANGSDHDPISIICNFSFRRMRIGSRSDDVSNVCIFKNDWSILTSDNLGYNHELGTFLAKNWNDNFKSLTCVNDHCVLNDHTNEIDDLFNTISSACLHAAERSGVSKKIRRFNSKHLLPDWNLEMKPLYKKSIFWHNLWIECERPKSGVVIDIMKKSRKDYHTALRKYRRNLDKTLTIKIANQLANGKQQDFWNSIRKLKGKNNSSISVIADMSDDQVICNRFASDYERLFNSSSSNDKDLDETKNILNNFKDISVITTNEVKTAINSLNKYKKDGSSLLETTHFKFGKDIIAPYISRFFTSMIIHGYYPKSMSVATITPIPKNKKGDMSDINNYRGISLNSPLGKIFELVILHKYKSNLKTSDLQFAYKRDISTTMCTFSLKEVCRRYIDNGSDVYCCMLDASKAFDRVNYSLLFKSLNSTGLPNFIQRIILNSYLNQRSCVRWKGARSDFFPITNGVKQGGILSATLFTIYYDNLVERLKSSKIGCYIGDMYCGTLVYADDVTLLCPSLCGLQKMIIICEQFSIDFSLAFNAKKTECIRFSKRKKDDDLVLIMNDQKLKWKNEIKHLGSIINCRLDDDNDIMDKKNRFISGTNCILHTFGKLPYHLRLKMQLTYCSSFYGSQSWMVNNKNLNTLYTCYRKAIRRNLRLPYRTHNRYIPNLTGRPDLINQLFKRFLRFCITLKHSENTIIKKLYVQSINNTKTIIGHNIRYISYKKGIPINKLLSNEYVFKEMLPDVEVECDAMCDLLLELLSMRDGILLECDILDSDEIDCLIENVATM